MRLAKLTGQNRLVNGVFSFVPCEGLVILPNEHGCLLFGLSVESPISVTESFDEAVAEINEAMGSKENK